MAKVDNQTIPSNLYDLYTGAIRPAVCVDGRCIVGRRSPWKLPPSKTPFTGFFGERPPAPSAKQDQIWHTFRKAVDCFNEQPLSGGVLPPTLGARSRAWWYHQAQGSGLFYYDYFIQQTINSFNQSAFCPWCTLPTAEISIAVKDWPNTHFDGYSSFNLANYGAFTNRLYIKASKASNPAAHDIYINIFIYNITRHINDPAGQQFILRVYAAASAWNKNTLTWNNAPAKGQALGNYHFDIMFRREPWPPAISWPANKMYAIKTTDATLAPFGYIVELDFTYSQININCAGSSNYLGRAPKLSF